MGSKGGEAGTAEGSNHSTHLDLASHPRETKLFSRPSATVLVIVPWSSLVRRRALFDPIELAGYEAMMPETYGTSAR
jgi:hypothetical protein